MCSNRLNSDLKKCVLLSEKSSLTTEISSQIVELEELTFKMEVTIFNNKI